MTDYFEDEEKTNPSGPGPNGSGSYAQQVAAVLMSLLAELRANRAASMAEEATLEEVTGLVMQPGVVVDPAIVGNIARFIATSADGDHSRGALKYLKVARLRALTPGRNPK